MLLDLSLLSQMSCTRLQSQTKAYYLQFLLHAVHFEHTESRNTVPTLHSSIETAAASRQAGRQVVIAAIASGGSARLFMPTYLESLRGIGNLDEHVVLLNLDADAQAYCSKVGIS
jgi:hypothetical protein